MGAPKETFYKYGREYQLKQAEKYKNRENNHWKFRIDMAKTLVERYSLPRFKGKPNKEVIVVDVGCSIGTFAIEFAKMGYQSFGIDLDKSALDIARQLSHIGKQLSNEGSLVSHTFPTQYDYIFF